MRNVLIFIFAMMGLCGCSLAFDPAGKLAAKRADMATSTAPVRPTDTPSARPSATAGIKCQATGDLNMRSAPSANAGIVDYFHTGDVVSSIGESAGWRQVRNWAGVVGWANAKWLRCGGW